MKKNNSIKKIAYEMLFLILIYIVPIETNISFMRYWDEIITIIVALFSLILFIRRGRIPKQSLKQILILLIVIAIGIMSNVIHKGLQMNQMTIIKDLFAFSKFFLLSVVIIGFTSTEYIEKNYRNMIRSIANVSRVLVVITAVCAVISYMTGGPFVFYSASRFIRVFRFVFPHPTYFVSAYILVLTSLVLDSLDRNRVYILLNCMLIILAQRDKGYIPAIIAFIAIIIGEKKCNALIEKVIKTGDQFIRKKRRIMFRYIIPIGIAIVALAYYVGRNKIFLYLQWGLNAARPALYIVGARIAMDFFPWGAGFGTFASTLSISNYSSLYDLYGISNVDGISRTFGDYAGDVYWPYVYGQLGFIGLFFTIILLVNIIRIQLIFAVNNKVRFAVVLIWIYILVASMAEAFFSNSTGVQFALFMGAFLRLSSYTINNETPLIMEKNRTI